MSNSIEVYNDEDGDLECEINIPDTEWDRIPEDLRDPLENTDDSIQTFDILLKNLYPNHQAVYQVMGISETRELSSRAFTSDDRFFDAICSSSNTVLRRLSRDMSTRFNSLILRGTRVGGNIPVWDSSASESTDIDAIARGLTMPPVMLTLRDGTYALNFEKLPQATVEQRIQEVQDAMKEQVKMNMETMKKAWESELEVRESRLKEEKKTIMGEGILLGLKMKDSGWSVVDHYQSRGESDMGSTIVYSQDIVAKYLIGDRDKKRYPLKTDIFRVSGLALPLKYNSPNLGLGLCDIDERDGGKTFHPHAHNGQLCIGSLEGKPIGSNLQNIIPMVETITLWSAYDNEATHALTHNRKKYVFYGKGKVKKDTIFTA